MPEDFVGRGVQRMIDTLFPRDVLTLCSVEEPDLDLLYPEEAVFIRGAVLKRRVDFAMGRLCARRALAQLGVRNFPILMGDDRAPVWPEGITGSISHCAGVCIVAVAEKSRIASVGIDIEPSEPLSRDLFRLILSESERASIETIPGPEAQRLAKLIFSAKESVYKCVYPLTSRFIDFQECTIAFDINQNAFTATLAVQLPGQWNEVPLCGRYASDERYVITGMHLASANDLGGES